MDEIATEELSVRDVLDRVVKAIESRDTTAIDDLAAHHPSELAQAIYRLPVRDLHPLVALIGDERMANIVENLDASQAADVLQRLTRGEAADVLEEMAPDDATDVLEEIPTDQAEGILIEMEPADAEEVRELLAYPPDTAGGLMTPEFVAVSPSLTAEEAIAAIRLVAAEAETIYYVYVTDPEDHLLGVLSLRGLLLARPGQTVETLMNRDVRKVYADEDQEQAARRFSEYHFLALPVVDRNNRLLGIITADDVADVIEEETTEDIERLGGSEPLQEPYLHASVVDIARKRIGWLLLLFIGQAYTGTVLSYFETELRVAISLTFFIPMLIGIGGNVGSQTVATIIRSMAIGEVGYGDALRVLLKELAVSLVLGTVMGVTSYVRAWTLGVDPSIGLVVGLTAVFVVLWAATVAAVLPLALRRLGIDPAVVSGPFISTVVDGTGLVIYFETARMVLGL